MRGLKGKVDEKGRRNIMDIISLLKPLRKTLNVLYSLKVKGSVKDSVGKAVIDCSNLTALSGHGHTVVECQLRRRLLKGQYF